MRPSPQSGGSPGPRVGALVVAAGAGQRMAGQGKVFLPLLGRPLISYSLNALEACSEVDAVVLVLARENLERGQELVRQGSWRKVVAVCPGGARRQDSVVAGLTMLDQAQWVVVHDGARPCLTPRLVSQGLAFARETGAAVAAVPVKDTIKVVKGGGWAVETPDRAGLWVAQTPQVFDAGTLRRAHAQVQDEVTDDAAMVERLGVAVKVYRGSYDNIKVTTPEDIPLAEALLRAQGHREPSEEGL